MAWKKTVIATELEREAMVVIAKHRQVSGANVWQGIPEELRPASRTTLYRILRQLTESGLISTFTVDRRQSAHTLTEQGLAWLEETATYLSGATERSKRAIGKARRGQEA